MYFYLLVALKLYCLYHFYKNRTNYYWVFVILFIPVLGPALYLITQVYNKRDAGKIQEEIVSIINPTKKIRDLEKQLQFSDSYQNRVNLADGYLEIKDYDSAINHYLNALEDNFQNDFYVIKQLMEAYFNVEDFENVVLYAEKIKTHSEFKRSRSQFLYGLGLEKLDKLDEAEAHLKQIDIRYSFYNERLVYANFLIGRDKIEEAKEVLDEIYNESQHMTKPNRRIYRSTIQEVEKLRANL